MRGNCPKIMSKMPYRGPVLVGAAILVAEAGRPSAAADVHEHGKVGGVVEPADHRAVGIDPDEPTAILKTP